MTFNQSQQTFSVKGQISEYVRFLGFYGLLRLFNSVIVVQSRYTQYVNEYHGCVPVCFIYKNTQ